MQNFSNILLKWHSKNPRHLPWKEDKDPYSIWLSEIIMQQTQVQQGTSYYLTFKKLFPTLFDLSNAKLDKILKAWEGLGYYSRARNLHITAKYIVNQRDGIFPKTAKELEKLKGIGPYTAAAIASFAYNEPIPAIDGNAYRVLSRYFNIDTPIDRIAGQKEFFSLAKNIMPANQSAQFNQAIMNFGALVCKPKKPHCSDCPFNASCATHALNIQEQRPVKHAKIKLRTRHFNYFIIHHKDQLLLQERKNPKDVWQNLYEFPLIESHAEQELGDLLIKEPFTHINTDKFVIKHTKKGNQRLSHQHIKAQFIYIDALEDLSVYFPDYKNFTTEHIKKLPFPKLINNVLKNSVT